MNEYFKGENFHTVEEIGSTNTYLMEQANQVGDFYALLAKKQTDGKGRLGRVWESKKNEGMYLSFLIKNFPREQLLLFPLVAAVGVTRALSALGVAGTKIKWPNDIILQEKKLGGVLCESRELGGGICLVTGMGLNLNQGAQYFEENNLPHGASIYSLTGKRLDSEGVARGILKQMDALYGLLTRGKLDIISLYKPLCVNLHNEVKLLYKNREVCGYTEDIAEDGALVVRAKNGETLRVTAGEVSVRGLYGYV